MDAPAHPELEEEQAYFDRAYDVRERLRARLQELTASGGASDGKATGALAKMNEKRLKSMAPRSQGVAFGRMDDDDGDVWYVGRQLIMDDHQRPLVINWQSPGASAYYQASSSDRLGLRRRRVFETEGNRITEIADTWLVNPERPELPVAVEHHVQSADPLLAALQEHRDGQMRDIVRTIQAEQDRIMRLAHDGMVVVQGGPGTGKTIIGLQRISVLLHAAPVKGERRMLFVGPSPAFVRYVDGVLPRLGDTDVVLLPMERLGPGEWSIRGSEVPAVSRTKGDPRMATLLARAVAARRNLPDADVTFIISAGTVRVSAALVRREVEQIVASNVPYNQGRQNLRDRLLTILSTGLAQQGDNRGAERSIRGSTDFQNLIDRVWPAASPAELLRDLLASERRLSELGEGLFSHDELQLLFRPMQQRITDEPWTTADIPLMDELNALLAGGSPGFDHIVVDEAQDLSPMQLRSLSRRSIDGSFTILGDLAQAIGPWAWRSWEELARMLDPDAEPVLATMNQGYRVPSEIMEVAVAVTEASASDVEPPTSFRSVGETPRFVAVADDEFADAAITEIKEHLQRGRSVGVIGASQHIEQLGPVLDYKSIRWSHVRRSTETAVTVLTADDAKGLEFDAVVVLEPAAVLEEALGNHNQLYVAMTRATQAMSVVSAQALPVCLEPFASVPAGAVLPVPETLEDFVPAVNKAQGNGHTEASPDAIGAQLEEQPTTQVSPTPQPAGYRYEADPAVQALARWLAEEIRGVVVPGRWESLLEAIADELGIIHPKTDD